MNVWQIFCAALAVMMPVLAAVRLVRAPSRQAWLLIAQVMVIPEAGLAAYAVSPGAAPDQRILVPLAVVFYGAAIAALVWGFHARRKLMAPTIGIEVLHRQHMAAFAARTSVILVMSAIVLTFEPWFGVANVVANAIWTLLWLPAGLRRVSFEVATDIAAPVATVFGYISDTDRWAQYREGFVRAEPPGRLGVGTRIMSRLTLLRLRADPRIARFIEVRSIVTSVEPGRSYTAMVSGSPDETGGVEVTELGPATTRVRSWARSRLSFLEGAMGLVFEVPATVALRRSEMERTAARLKEVVEAAPTQ